MNLFLYIPPHSAHPPGMIKSLIFGLLRTYKLQNSYQSNFISTAKLLHQCLLDRGYSREIISPIFSDALEKLHRKPPWSPNPQHRKDKEPSLKKHKERLFFHLQYHPQDISRRRISTIYNTYCGTDPNFATFQNEITLSPMNITKFTVAYSRSKNLCDVLSPSTLHE